MRICIYSHAFPPSVGGVQAHSARLAASLSAHGHDVVVITRTPEGNAQDESLPYRLRRQPTTATLIRQVVASDVVQLNTWSIPLALVARALGKPTVWFHHDYDTVCPKSIAWNGYRCHYQPLGCTRCLARDHSWTAVTRRHAAFALRRSLRGLVSAHAVHTPFVARRLGLQNAMLLGTGTSLGPHLPAPSSPAERRHAVPAREELVRSMAQPTGTPLSIADGEGPGVRHAAGAAGSGDAPAAPAAGPVVLFLGRLIAEKGADVLLRALRHCRDSGVALQVTIAGDGPERVGLTRLAGALGIEKSVHFRGMVSAHGVAELIRQADCVVIPSLWDEPTGLGALEAMALGVPVVAARVGGLAGLVDGNGLLFERGDARDLARQLLRLVADRPLQQRLAGAGQRQVQASHDWYKVARDYIAAYRSLITGVEPAQP